MYKKIKFAALVLALSALAISLSINANAEDALTQETEEAILNGNLFIENSYIIGFKKASVFNQDADDNLLIEQPDELKRGQENVPFGEHSTGQSKETLAVTMGLQGEVLAIFDTINAVHVKMDAEEAEKWREDERVEYVEQDLLMVLLATQNNPGWALDRIDEITTPTLDNTYVYNKTGAGRTIYVLDSGLDLRIPQVAAEFGGRAQIIWDVNYSGGYPTPSWWGADCNGHGTSVASVIAGNTKGVAKGASLKIAKVTIGCTFLLNNDPVRLSHIVTALNWIAFNTPAGTIVNLSNGIQPGGCGPVYHPGLDNTVKAAHNNGIIVVVAAANDGCNTANFSPTHIPEAFVVGGTIKDKILSHGKDERHPNSRTGTNVSTFAPGVDIPTLNHNGTPITPDGTSLSTAIVSGIFALACQSAAPFCDNLTTAAPVYTNLRNTGVIGTVTDPGGATMSGATSRFIPQRW